MRATIDFATSARMTVDLVKKFQEEGTVVVACTISCKICARHLLGRRAERVFLQASALGSEGANARR